MYTMTLTLLLSGGSATAAPTARTRRPLRRDEAAVALFASNQRDAAA
jgi:hypothetical protein